MQASNLASRTMRTSESGLVWEEKLSGGQGTLEVFPCQTFRVRSTGAATVTIDGILAMTMSAGEIAIFCAGEGDPTDNKSTVTVLIGGANVYLQTARIADRVNPNN